MARITAALALVLAVAAISACSSAEAETAAPQAGAVTTIAAADLAQLVEMDAVRLIDVRTPEEFAEGHLPGAVNVPLDQFDPETLPPAEGKQTILYCRSARRSGEAADLLAAHDGEGATHLDGGILAWDAAGLPVANP